jgi:hypothetical protein
MGRHSAPDDPEADSAESAVVATVQLDAAQAGRHSRSDAPEAAEAPEAEVDDAHTQRIAIISVEPEAAPSDTDILPRVPAEPAAPEPETAKPARRESGTRADLRLLRQNSAVRAQAIGAVIVSFLLYTVIMVVLGRTGSYLPWLFVPIVVAGFLVGLVLDLAHRRAGKS